MIQWWCAAQTGAWSWAWTAYPGVWLVILAIAAAGHALYRRGLDAGAAPAAMRRRRLSFLAGAALLWVSLDWPVGALGAGYLAFVHMIQFLLIALAAPPLLLMGIAPEALPRLRPDGFTRRALHAVGHPLVALIVFEAIVIGTHMPFATDGLMRTQLGSFVVDILWLAGGLLYWSPIVGPLRRAGMGPMLRMGYLFANMVFMTAPGAMITFSEYPIYGLYELAPRIGDFPAIDDQRLAGLLMKVVGGAITWIAISIIFYRWHREENLLLDRELAEIAGGEVAAS
jgi:cytochrome c oxidase assembly factor CtaG